MVWQEAAGTSARWGGGDQVLYRAMGNSPDSSQVAPAIRTLCTAALDGALGTVTSMAKPGGDMDDMDGMDVPFR